MQPLGPCARKTEAAAREAQPHRVYEHLVVGLLTSRNGVIYSDDHEALEALNLVAQALGQKLTVQVIER